MIARTWHVVVPAAQSDAYLDLMRRIELPKYLLTRGHRAAWCLRRTEGNTTQFQILTFWDDTAAIAHLAGDDYEVYSDTSSDRHRDDENTIARIWRGVVPVEKGEAYSRYLRDFGFRDYQASTGNRGVQLLRRTDAAQAHFLLVSFWSSRQAIAAYAGADMERAHYYPYDPECLVNPARTVEHYEVLSALALGDTNS
jgi:heme-degrading monooxygenase HmoA